MFLIIKESEAGSSMKVISETFSIEGVVKDEADAERICRMRNGPEKTKKIEELGPDWRDGFDDDFVYHYEQVNFITD